MPLSFLQIKLWDHLRNSRISCFFLILFLAFTFVKGVKGSGSGNPFSVAQYCPAGTPQESLAQITKDPRKDLHQSSLSDLPSTRERMQPIPWPQVPSSWSKCACGLLSRVHYCDRAIIINSLRQHQRHPQIKQGRKKTVEFLSPFSRRNGHVEPPSDGRWGNIKGEAGASFTSVNKRNTSL